MGFSRRPDLADRIAGVAFVLFASAYVYLIFYKEHFSYYDNSQVTDFSLRGRVFPPPIWPSAGRFFPLALQEFNVLALFTKSPAGYHSFAVVQLVILIVALFAVLKHVKVLYRVLIVTAAMLAPSFVIPFTGLMYPERNVLFWLAIMVLCLCGYSRTKASIYFVGCLVATQFALYYKETVVVFVVAFAATRMLLEVYLGRRVGHSWSEVASENSLPLGMLLLAGIYAAFFSLALFPFHSFSYVSGGRETLGSVLWTYLQTDWLPWILLIIFVIRMRRIVFAGDEPDPLWEPLAVGALAYSLALIVLGIASGYYMAPADFIALLYVARISIRWLSEGRRVRTALVAAAFSCLALHNTAYSALRVIERKGVITSKARFARFLARYAATRNGRPIELFFPYANGYRLMELSAYLEYRGFHMNRRGASSVDAAPVVFVEGRRPFQHNLCVDYRDYVCTRTSAPHDGALIVVLPDDNASREDVETIGRRSTSLFSYNACPVCSRNISRLSWLHAITPMFPRSKLPEDWLQLHVFAKGPATAPNSQKATTQLVSGKNAFSGQKQ